MTEPASDTTSPKPVKPPVERLYPFALRARVVVVGEALLARLKKKLHFILISEDISEKRIVEICRQFSDLPVLQCYTAESIETFFGFKNTKVLGFKKSSLAVSIHKELKKTAKRLNMERNQDGPKKSGESSKCGKHETQPDTGLD